MLLTVTNFPVASFMVQICPDVSVAFPGSTNSLDEFRAVLAELDKRETILYCARLHLIYCAEEPQNVKQQKALEWFFSDQQRMAILNRYGTPGEIAIFCRGSLLELMRWVSLFGKESAEINKHFFRDHLKRQLLGKALLIANKIWLKTIECENLPSIDEMNEESENFLWKMRMNVMGTRIGIAPHWSLGVGYGLFCDSKFFQKSYTPFLREFEAIHHCSSEEYFYCHSWLSANLLGKTVEQTTTNYSHTGLFSLEQTLTPVTTNFHERLTDYFNENVQNLDQLKEAFWGNTRTVNSLNEVKPINELVIRSHSIIKTDDGRAIIADPVFYNEGVSIGALFNLVRAKTTKVERDGVIEKFGDAFANFVGQIFSNVYSSGCSYANDVAKTGPRGMNTTEGNSQIEICDVAVYSDSEIILMEVKAVFLPLKEWLCDSNKYVALLKERYVENKGVGQLAKSISKLAIGDWRCSEIDFSSKEVIFPILFTHDNLLDSWCHPRFFSNEFERILVPDQITRDGYLRKGSFLVAPLILMTIDDLILMENSIKTQFEFRKLLRDYTARYPKRDISLMSFIGESEYAEKLRGSRSVAQYGYKLSKRTQDVLFPGIIGRIRRFFRRLYRDLIKKLNLLAL